MKRKRKVKRRKRDKREKRKVKIFEEEKEKEGRKLSFKVFLTSPHYADGNETKDFKQGPGEPHD